MRKKITDIPFCSVQQAVLWTDPQQNIDACNQRVGKVCDRTNVSPLAGRQRLIVWLQWDVLVQSASSSLLADEWILWTDTLLIIMIHWRPTVDHLGRNLSTKVNGGRNWGCHQCPKLYLLKSALSWNLQTSRIHSDRPLLRILLALNMDQNP